MLTSAELQLAITRKKSDFERKVKLLIERNQPMPPGEFYYLQQDIKALEAMQDIAIEAETDALAG